MTKLFQDPCTIINSNLYRFGDPEMRTVEDLGKDTIAKCSEGKMEFLGIPERFLKKVTVF